MMEQSKFFSEEFEKETTTEHPSIEPGYYVGAMGRSYSEETKNGYKSKVFEVILISRVGENDTKIRMTDVVTVDGKVAISIRKDKNGNLITDSVIYPIRIWEIREDATAKSKNFRSKQRRDFARAFHALNEETGIIDWSAIQKAAGTVVAFQLTENWKNKAYLPDLDFSTFGPLPAQFATLDSIAKIYETLDSLTAASSKGEVSPDEPPF